MGAVPVMAEIVPVEGTTQVNAQDDRFDIWGGVTSSQGDNLFYQFEQFSLSSGESAIFHVPDPVQNVFGQILGGQAAYINGRLAIAGAPANLYLINPAGILFGPDARLSLPGRFTATTASRLGFDNSWLTADFQPSLLNGAPQQFVFSDPATSILNLGDLAVGEGQSITLSGGTVINRGRLSAPAGAITLVAVEQGTLQVTQSGQLLRLVGETPTTDWQLAAADLPSWLTGSEVDHALGLTQSASGETLITGSQLTLGPAPGTALIAGTLTTVGPQVGGTVQVLGQQVALVDATVQADGALGGGNVHIGGERQGGGMLPTAALTVVNDGTVISASASEGGDGGEIIVWADELTHFTGTVLARGGALSGDGGFVEISGQEQLHFQGEVAVDAPVGKPGTLLFDPRNILIRRQGGTGTDDSLLPTLLANSTAVFEIFEHTLESLDDANIILQASDNIEIQAMGRLIFKRSVGGSLRFEADADGDGVGSFTMRPSDQIYSGGRDLTIVAASITAGDLITGNFAEDNADPAGRVTLATTHGSIAVQEISAASRASEENAGLGAHVSLASAQDITVGDIHTNSYAGEDNAANAGNVSLIAQGDITVGDIDASSIAEKDNAGEGGSIFLSAADGSITAGDLNTTARAFRDRDAGAAGDVTLAATDSITLDYVNAEAETAGGRVEISTGQQLTLSDNSFTTLTGESASISTIGRSDGGSIRLQIPTEEAFQIGEGGSQNGATQGLFSSSTNSLRPAQTLTETTTIGDIQIILADALPSVTPPVTPPGSPPVLASVTEQLSPPTVATPQLLTSESSELAAAIVDGSQSESTVKQLALLESSFAEQFSRQLGLAGEYDMPLAFSLEQMQQVLETAEDRLQVNPALVYLYFADDRLEALVVTSRGEPFHQMTELTRDQVLQLGQAFRWAVTNPTLLPSDYLPTAQALHQALIKPIEAELNAKGIDNLAFVLDQGLRSLPLAALHDGEQFLIERYAVGILPTFNLTDFDWTNTLHHRRASPAVLAMGIAEFAEQPTLPAVPTELQLIAQKQQDRTYLNADSTFGQLQRSLAQGTFDIVHLATHALFDPGASEQAYVQLWDQAIHFNQLKSLDLQAANVSLLVLSACKTALGDEAAEFGFAGLAVSTGAQSALASLWAVSDEGALGFMSQFYRQLRLRPVRSEALQQTQIAMLRGQVSIDQGTLYGPDGHALATLPELVGSGRWDFSHPVYWSAFSLIGNPW
ncbi:MAG: CHAT domain-containing protein [Cyanobacteria bacterium P01_A01_bin.105]